VIMITTTATCPITIHYQIPPLHQTIDSECASLTTNEVYTLDTNFGQAIVPVGQSFLDIASAIVTHPSLMLEEGGGCNADPGCVISVVAAELTKAAEHQGISTANGKAGAILETGCTTTPSTAPETAAHLPNDVVEIHVLMHQRLWKTASQSVQFILSSLAPHAGFRHFNMWDRLAGNTFHIHSSAKMCEHAFEDDLATLLRSYNPVDPPLQNVAFSHHATYQNLGGLLAHLMLGDASVSVTSSMITFVRHPVARLRSAYYYAISDVGGVQALDEIERRKNDLMCGCADVDFETCTTRLMNEPSCQNVLPGFSSDLSYVKMMSGLPCPNEYDEAPSFSEHFTLASQNVKSGSYAVVGVTEFMEISHAVLACKLPAYFGLLSPSNTRGETPAVRKTWVAQLTRTRKNKMENDVEMPSAFGWKEMTWLETHPLVHYDMLLYNEILASLFEDHAECTAGQ
jgi:hypothetical protein